MALPLPPFLMPITHPLANLIERAAPITGEELAHLPDLGPRELVRGRIKPMSPTGWKHGDLVSKLDHRLREFVQQHRLGKVLTGEVGIYTQRDPDTVRGADVAFISYDRLRQVTSDSFLDAAPELVVEVISPSNTWPDLEEKIDEYFEMGVERVWLVEPERRQLHVYRAPDTFARYDADDTLRADGRLHASAGRALCRVGSCNPPADPPVYYHSP